MFTGLTSPTFTPGPNERAEIVGVAGLSQDRSTGGGGDEMSRYQMYSITKGRGGGCTALASLVPTGLKAKPLEGDS